ncbi:hypothetical protein [Marivita sp. S2033]|uniref:hypothetical protein n=1 Tax=Marivita sp. S2033 TaxID=3373187 RepID=UPI0039826238
MMISKADLDELFPAYLNKSKRSKHSDPSQSSLSRWKDDGGMVLPSPSDSDESPEADGNRAAAKSSYGLTALPAMVFYASAWSMLSGFGRASGA